MPAPGGLLDQLDDTWAVTTASVRMPIAMIKTAVTRPWRVTGT